MAAITQRNGDLTVVTLSPEDEQRIRQFEQEAIKANSPVVQHGASMIEYEEEKQHQQSRQKPTLTASSPLTLYRLMKKIAGQAETSIPSTTTIEFQPHIASTAEKSVTNKENSDTTTNIKLLGLMKKIASAASPFSL